MAKFVPKHSHPIMGYPSKKAAIRALHDNGMTPFMIAKQIGSTVDSVYVTISALRREAKAAGAAPSPRSKTGPKQATAAEPDTRGIWTPEKLTRARRLFGKTMIYIAEALQVPADELLRYALNGTLPPIGTGQRLGDLLAQMAENGAPLPSDMPALPAPETPPQPSREDDEAELAALENATEAEEPDDGAVQRINAVSADSSVHHHDAADGGLAGTESLSSEPPPPVDQLGGERVREEAHPAPAPEPAAPADAPPAAETAQDAAGSGDHLEAVSREPGAEVEQVPPGLTIRTYRIKGTQPGTYLHKSENTFTRHLAQVWTGTAPAMERLFKRHPDYRDLDPERVPG